MNFKEIPITPLPPEEQAKIDTMIAHVTAGKQCEAMTCYSCRAIGKVKRVGVDWSFKCPKCGVTACGRN